MKKQSLAKLTVKGNTGSLLTLKLLPFLLFVLFLVSPEVGPTVTMVQGICHPALSFVPHVGHNH